VSPAVTTSFRLDRQNPDHHVGPDDAADQLDGGGLDQPEIRLGLGHLLVDQGHQVTSVTLGTIRS